MDVGVVGTGLSDFFKEAYGHGKKRRSPQMALKPPSQRNRREARTAGGHRSPGKRQCQGGRPNSIRYWERERLGKIRADWGPLCSVRRS